jgi:hypothetical protein
MYVTNALNEQIIQKQLQWYVEKSARGEQGKKSGELVKEKKLEGER